MRFPLLASLLLVALPALGQDPSPPPTSETLPVPRWELGDSWLIATYAREPVASGPGTPALARPLEGLSPLRGGVPLGWVEVARWRFRVERRATLRHPEDPRSAKPLRCWVLSARRVAPGERGSLELWFSADALRLLRVVERSAQAPPRETWLGGALTYAPRLAARLGLPLAWPDWSARGASARVEQPDGERLTQSSEPARPDALRKVTFSRGGTPLLRFRFGLAHPWWLELRGMNQQARMLSWSRGKSDSKAR